jgi:arylsulfatase A-like enzyme
MVGPMGRKILFITTDQQRYDALGCNGGTVARTPVADRLAATGINYRRAHNQNVVCMPARSTMVIWRPAPAAGVTPAVIEEPVGQLDLAPTFCRIAGAPVPEWIQGAPLPTAPGSGRERVLTEWDSQFAQVGMHLRTIYRDGYICTVYEPTTQDVGWDLARMLAGGDVPLPEMRYDGTEGELYDVRADPHQWRNLWDDPGSATLRGDLVADLYDHLPRPRAEPLPVQAPA